MVKTITDNIITRLPAVLGSGFVKLSFGSDVSLNKFGRSTKRFAVTPSGAFSTFGAVGINTIDHKWLITLTDGYMNGAAAQLNDDLKMAKIAELQDLALKVFSDLQLNKATISTGILIVNNLIINDIEFLEEEKVAVLKFELNIKYKTV